MAHTLFLPYDVAATVEMRSASGLWEPASLHTHGGQPVFLLNIGATYRFSIRNGGTQPIVVSIFADGMEIAPGGLVLQPGAAHYVTGFAEGAIPLVCVPADAAGAAASACAEETSGLRNVGAFMFKVTFANAVTPFVSVKKVFAIPAAAQGAMSARTAGGDDAKKKKFGVGTRLPDAAELQRTAAGALHGTQQTFSWESDPESWRTVHARYGDRAALLLLGVPLPPLLGAEPAAVVVIDDGGPAAPVVVQTVIDVVDLCSDGAATERLHKVKVCVNDGRFVMHDVLLPSNVLEAKSAATSSSSSSSSAVVSGMPRISALIAEALHVGAVYTLWSDEGDQLSTVADVSRLIASAGAAPALIVAATAARQVFDDGDAAELTGAAPRKRTRRGRRGGKGW